MKSWSDKEASALVRAVFDYYDTDRDGFVDSKTAAQLLRVIGFPKTEFGA